MTFRSFLWERRWVLVALVGVAALYATAVAASVGKLHAMPPFFEW